MQLDGAKVAGIARAMRAGKIKDKAISVARGGYILDGHHRWAAKVVIDTEDGILGNDITMPVLKIDADIGSALDWANAHAKGAGILPKGLGANKEGIKKKNKNSTEAVDQKSDPSRGRRLRVQSRPAAHIRRKSRWRKIQVQKWRRCYRRKRKRSR
jgi:hypothetical protein